MILIISQIKIFFSEHHLSHAASAFYPSPFEEAIIITADGVGEWATTTVAIGKKIKLILKKKLLFPIHLVYFIQLLHILQVSK